VRAPPPCPPDEALAQAMERALQLARLAAERDEVPVGAVVLGPDGVPLAEAHNETESLRDPTAHAERLALARACAACGTTRLPEGSVLAVTLEPCAMCAGALVLARASYLLFGALDPKAGACGSLRDLVRDPRLNHRVVVLPSRRAPECGALLSAFFLARRGPATEG
jgi:tRNA(adenine34) deaminase